MACVATAQALAFQRFSTIALADLDKIWTRKAPTLHGVEALGLANAPGNKQDRKYRKTKAPITTNTRRVKIIRRVDPFKP